MYVRTLRYNISTECYFVFRHLLLFLQPRRVALLLLLLLGVDVDQLAGFVDVHEGVFVGGLFALLPFVVAVDVVLFFLLLVPVALVARTR